MRSGRIVAWRRLGAAAIGVAALALGVRLAASREARDRYAVRRHLERMERMIRTHDQALWPHVEASAHPAKDGAHEALHRGMLRDFDRLTHLEGFAMMDIHVEIHGDSAWARYRVEGWPASGREPAPAAGEMRFVRGRDGWEMAGHRLFEAGEQPTP